jgi:CBS domain-containing protein/beta-phosphoglucomutase-like phosphatase (HAD superfamily)
MTLEAIIIRADGAFAETEELRRQSFVAAFREAGFSWDVEKIDFARSRKLGSLQQRMEFFVRQFLKRRTAEPDVDQLITAMHRTAGKAFCQLLEGNGVAPRVGMRELIVAARQDGLRLVLASSLRRVEVDRLLVQGLGSRGAEAFDTVTTLSDWDAAAEPVDLYRQVLADIAVEPANCLVIEATLSGGIAAKSAGIPAIVTRSAFCTDSPEAGDSVGVFEDLLSVLTRTGKRRLEPLSVDERTDLLAAMHRVYSGRIDGLADSNRSDAMRVSDILKTKGSAVKTIEATATIRAFAQGLRVEAVGAMVVKDATGAVQGIISERDLARGLAEFGSDLPSMPVSALMTKSVITCAPEDSVAAVAKVMTQRRIRHLPVVVSGTLAGVISIGDVIKHRLDEVQMEANVLRDYAIARK